MKVLGKNAKLHGVAPAIGLIDPRYAHNVGAAVRAASCFGFGQVWFSGDRVRLQVQAAKRVPREERMKGFRDVELINFDHFVDQFPADVTPVAVELRPNAEMLPDFEHPENPLYVLGPEDGSIPQSVLKKCHRFVVIPTRHCTNLAAAVYLMLYDRLLKRIWSGKEPAIAMADLLASEKRGAWGSTGDPKIDAQGELWGVGG